MTKQELFTKVTGLTFDVEKIPADKLAWLIPDGAMLENTEGAKFQLTQSFVEEAGLDASSKVNALVESTINNEDPTKKPAGKGWKKVVDVAAVAGSAEYWTLNGVNYDSDPTEAPCSFDYVWNEATWNASYENGGLKAYYEWADTATTPYREDMWNTVAERAANGSDWHKENDEYVFDENGNYIYDNCVRCWLGALNAPEAKYPWVVITPPKPFTGKIKFVYDGGEAVYPYGAEVKTFGKGFGCVSVPTDLGAEFLLTNGETAFDANKLVVTLEWDGVEHVPAVEAVEEQYHWERTVVQE